MKTNHDFLFEIVTEELPPKNLRSLETSLKEELLTELKNHGLTHGKTKTFATPRRLAILIENLTDKQEPQLIERKGPSLSVAFDKDNNPTKAAHGFARSCKVDIDKLTKFKSGAGSWLLYASRIPGEKTTKILPELIKQALKKLPVAKLMRWGDYDIEFARPVHSITLIYGSKIVPCEILNKKSSNKTVGHRFLGKKSITINTPKNYEKLLKKDGHVIADFEKRKKIIEQQIMKKSATHGKPLIDEELLNEVTAIVEYPVALCAKFSERFLKIPKECLISSMQIHQKCFPIMKRGKLVPFFIATSNIKSKKPKLVIEGNERVMHARLSDAEFFYQRDLSHKFENLVEQLKNVLFQTKLGTLYDKTERLIELSTYLAKHFGSDQKMIKRAAFLSKADLMSEMVGEFPELQGTMGYYYAKHADEAIEVCNALREQYLPIHAADKLPKSKPGIILSLANRIDNLIGIFGINKKPNGDKDPFSLRRAAIGIIKILIENSLDIDLSPILKKTSELYKKNLSNNDVVADVIKFIMQRFKFWSIENGFTAEQFAAVASSNFSSIYDFYLRMKAVAYFSKLPEAASLSAANKRVKNLLAKQTELMQPTHTVDRSTLTEPAEKVLANMIEQKTILSKKLLTQKKYIELLQELATLKEPINNFFDNVMVIVENEDIRINRICLVSHLRELFLQIADISVLQL